MSILIKDAWVVTQNERREVFKGDVYVEDNIIADTGHINVEAETVIKGGNYIVIPGLINTHNHVPMTDMRGLADDLELDGFLERMWKLEAVRDEKDIFNGAKIGIDEMLSTGTTSFMDMYSDEDIVAKVAKDKGIRAFLGWAVVDDELTTQKGSPIKNAEKFIKEFEDEQLITPLVAPHGVYTCSEETLHKAKELAERYNTLMTMHVSETRKEVYEHRKKTGKRPVEYLESIDFLSPRLMAVHLVWLTLNEIRMLAMHEVKASHNPTSNMKLGTGGSMPLVEMLNEGMLITLGTDSAVSNNNLDMFEVMKIAAILHKNERWSAAVTNAQMILDFATINAAEALGLNAGTIEEGKLADMAVIDASAPNAQPLKKDTLVSNVVYSLSGQNVKYTIVDGKIVFARNQG